MQAFIISSDDIPERTHGFFHAYLKYFHLYFAIVACIMLASTEYIRSVWDSAIPTAHADQVDSVEYICQVTSDLESVRIVTLLPQSSVVRNRCARLQQDAAMKVAIPQEVLAAKTKNEESHLADITITTSKNESVKSKKETVLHDSVEKNSTHSQNSAEVLVSGYPIAQMLPAMNSLDKNIQGFLIGIAKKESDWGKHVPKKSGKDCYNYWGYKGNAGRGSANGYACFNSPEEAVSMVGAKLSKYVINQHKDTASKMLVWKCGSSCAGHDPAGVASWVQTVDMYRKKIR